MLYNEKISVPYTEKISEKMKIFQFDRHNHFIITIGIAVDQSKWDHQCPEKIN